jgi:hypothetical protein
MQRLSTSGQSHGERPLRSRRSVVARHCVPDPGTRPTTSLEERFTRSASVALALSPSVSRTSDSPRHRSWCKQPSHGIDQ